jgi:hypothetical protein
MIMRQIEAQAGGGRYPEDVSDEFERATRDVATATDGSIQVEVTLGGVRKAAMLVHPDLVAYALRHGWGR